MTSKSPEFLTDNCFNLFHLPPQVDVHLKNIWKNIWVGLTKLSTSWHSGMFRVSRYHCILFACNSSLGLQVKHCRAISHTMESPATSLVQEHWSMEITDYAMHVSKQVEPEIDHLNNIKVDLLLLGTFSSPICSSSQRLAWSENEVSRATCTCI